MRYQIHSRSSSLRPSSPSSRRSPAQRTVLAAVCGLLLLAAAAHGQDGYDLRTETAEPASDLVPTSFVLDPDKATSVRALGGEDPGKVPVRGGDKQPTPGWTTIVYETAEGAFPSGNGWTVSDLDPASGFDSWDDLSCRSYAGSWSIWCADNGDQPDCGHYDNDQESLMVIGPFSLADAVDARAEFRIWSEIEDCCDSVAWGASINGTSFSGNQLTRDTSGWELVTFDFTNVPGLGDLRGQPNVWFAFRFFSDFSVTFEGTYLDEIVIEKLTGATECFSNSDCAQSDYCSKTTCEPTAPGTCVPRPQTCTTLFDPVCGCDGFTHSNACFAGMAGANVSHAGECASGGACTSNAQCSGSSEDWCEKPQGLCGGTGTCQDRPPLITCDFLAPVCGCDGVTYDSECHAHRAFVNVAHPGACGGGGGCGSNADCVPGAFCDKPDALCGGAGTCAAIPQSCTLQVDPVCGCDGVTYQNDCLANNAGTSVAHLGECTAQCPGGGLCLSNADCGPGDFCDRPDAMCGGVGTCVTRPATCTGLFDPVCGCDDVTYSNACLANDAGTSVGYAGQCTTCVDDLDNGVVCLFDNRFEFSMTWTNQQGVTRPVFFKKETPRTALVYFFSGRQDIALNVKVVEGCAFNGHWWIWTGGASGAGAAWSLTVRDTLTGRTQSYFKPFGEFPIGSKDETSFPCP